MRAPRLALIGGIALAIATHARSRRHRAGGRPDRGRPARRHAHRHRPAPRRLGPATRRAQRPGEPEPDLRRAAAARRPRRIRVVGRLAGSAQPRSSMSCNRGSTLWDIARRYGVSVSAIVTANRSPTPAASSPASASSSPEPPRRAPRLARAERRRRPRPAQPAPVVHVVNRGSTLWDIARALRRERERDRRRQPHRQPEPHLRRPAPRHPRRERPGHRARRRRAQACRHRWPSWSPSATGCAACIVREADRQGVPRALALAVAWQESGWQQGVVSHAGAVGVMQLMPGTAEWIGETMLGRPVPHQRGAQQHRRRRPAAPPLPRPLRRQPRPRPGRLLPGPARGRHATASTR